MIHVEIAPAHPVGVTHHAEHWMGLQFEISRLAGEAVQKNKKLRFVLIELKWWCAALFGVHLRTSRHTAWPWQ